MSKDKFEKIYEWRKNRFKNKRRLPQKIRNDNDKGIYYNVDVAIPTITPNVYKIYQDSPAILSFMGHEPIAFWRRSIASYQAELEFEVK